MFPALVKSIRLSMLALLVAAVAGCNRGAGQQAQARGGGRPAPAVSAAAAVTRDVPVYLDEIGKTVAIDMVSIVPQVGGKVIAAHVEDGAFVSKGQLLFEIDPAPFNADLAAAKASRAQAEAELIWAQADFKRTQELLATNVASQLEFDQKKSNLGVAEARIDAAKAAIQSAQLDVEYTKIYSPIDGRAGVRMVDPGNIVKENGDPMLVIQQIEPIYAEFTVTENDLGTVRKFLSSHGMTMGDESSLGLKVLVDVPADSARILTALGGTTQPSAPATEAREGKLTFLDNSVQSGTGTIRLRATVPNEDNFFWPGQFVNVRLVLTTKTDAVLIPQTAVQIGQQGPFVYVVANGEIEDPVTKEKKPVTIARQKLVVPGQRQGNLVVIDSGVEPTDKVVVSGQMQVTDGAPITVMEQPQPAPTTATASAH